jgi:hypothetical protein
MSDEKVRENHDGIGRLQSAAEEFARTEIVRLAQMVIEKLRSRPAIGSFGDDVEARHMWDEYCWALQEGPFDVDMGWDEVRLGTLSDAWGDTVRAFVSGEVEKLPQHALVFLSMKAFDEDSAMEEDQFLGSVWVEGIVNVIMDEVKQRASQRKLDLIGPHRTGAIGHEIEGCGVVWSALSDRGEALDIIANHTDAMLDPDADLSELAAEMIEGWLIAAEEELDEARAPIVSGFFEAFGDKIRGMLTESDVLPALKDMRDGLLERLDG